MADKYLGAGIRRENGFDRPLGRLVAGVENFAPAKQACKHSPIAPVAEQGAIHRPGHPDIAPYRTVDELNNAAVTKLRNLLPVSGRVGKSGGRRAVTSGAARMYSGFRFGEFCAGLREGRIAVDFDARTAGGAGNRGTKFRTRTRDVARLYKDAERVEA